MPQMKKAAQALIVSIIVTLTLLLAGYGIVMFEMFSPYSENIKPVMVEIPYGMPSKQIATVLREKNVIRSRTFLIWYIKFTQKENKLRAGAFLFPPSMKLVEVVENLENENGAARLIRVTIPEGFTIWDIGYLLSKKKLVAADVFVDYAHHEARHDFEEEFPFLKTVPGDTIEGYLYPDTYLFSPGSPPKVIIRILLREFEKKIIPVWDRYNSIPLSNSESLNFHQTLTLASLIQKEAGNNTEMSMISSVFHNRLKKKMKLASDPTVVYALGQSHKERVLYKDLKVDSLYNTYKYAGLPPCPISTISLNSFCAALEPEKSDFLFFVADKEGAHIFTKTYKQHIQAQKPRLKKR